MKKCLQLLLCVLVVLLTSFRSEIPSSSTFVGKKSEKSPVTGLASQINSNRINAELFNSLRLTTYQVIVHPYTDSYYENGNYYTKAGVYMTLAGSTDWIVSPVNGTIHIAVSLDGGITYSAGFIYFNAGEDHAEMVTQASGPHNMDAYVIEVWPKSYGNYIVTW